jgi:phosphomethylpyrimidine synthase
MTRIEAAKKRIISAELQACAIADGIDPKQLCRYVAQGKTVILRNIRRSIQSITVGKGAPVRVNANVGSSDSASSCQGELVKMQAAIAAGADTIMDLSTGADMAATRELLLRHATVPVGSVPLYEAMANHASQGGAVADLSVAAMLDAIETHVKAGIDFVTVHSGIRRCHLEACAGRTMGIVSRGGSFLAQWMSARREENPLYSHYNEVLEILRPYDVTISLGDALRPGAIADAGDRTQYAELRELAKLARRARAAGIQAIIEGPGHVPLHQVADQVRLQKRLCRGAPFYILGPLVTDCAAGYDHIAGAIGGALAAMAGADFLCYLTPREHLGLPDVEHVIEGVAASRVAAHAADLTRRTAVGKRALQRDMAMSKARLNLDWPGQFTQALQPERARTLFKQAGSGESCSMCGVLCSARRHGEFNSVVLP